MNFVFPAIIFDIILVGMIAIYPSAAPPIFIGFHVHTFFAFRLVHTRFLLSFKARAAKPPCYIFTAAKIIWLQPVCFPTISYPSEFFHV